MSLTAVIIVIAVCAVLFVVLALLARARLSAFSDKKSLHGVVPSPTDYNVKTSFRSIKSQRAQSFRTRAKATGSESFHRCAEKTKPSSQDDNTSRTEFDEDSTESPNSGNKLFTRIINPSDLV